MKLYHIQGGYFDSNGIGDFGLWVRAADEAEAFRLCVAYYEVDDGGGPGGYDDQEDGPYTREFAERHFGGGFGIMEEKTYMGQLPPAGAISWADVDRLLIKVL